MAGLMLVLLLGYWLWRRFYREDVEDSDARRVAKNSLAPIALQLANKLIETAFAALMLRILGPDAAGKYYFAITIWVWLDIFTTFGLNILLQREVAKDRALGNQYLANTTILRLVLIVIAAPLLAMFIGARQLTRPLAGDTIAALVLLAVGLIPGSLANGFTAVFNAFEKMEYPAAITTVTTVLKVVLGTLVLLLGWGFVGLAGLSIAINIITAAILLYLLVHHCFRPHFELDFSLQRWMVDLSWPLMLNNLLSTFFFKIDVALLESMKGNTVVGLYSVAYKFMDALNILPASFTIAVFPIMSRYAASARLTHCHGDHCAGRASGLSPWWFPIPPPFAHCPATHDLVHTRGLHQQRYSLRPDCFEPAALLDQGLRHWPGLHRGSQPDFHPHLQLSGLGSHPPLLRTGVVVALLLLPTQTSSPRALGEAALAAIPGGGADGGAEGVVARGKPVIDCALGWPGLSPGPDLTGDVQRGGDNPV